MWGILEEEIWKWGALPQDIINRSIDAFRRLIHKVIKVEGRHN